MAKKDYDKVMKEIDDGRRDSTGLKSAILRLKEMCHADIEVASVIGEGTQIYIFIPDYQKE
ncbi:MAG: hypothetical protein Q4E53_03665 [Eubacteriales bacterium]|nr:hypothetical protein [Eubacteriales bacterium]